MLFCYRHWANPTPNTASMKVKNSRQFIVLLMVKLIVVAGYYCYHYRPDELAQNKTLGRSINHITLS